MPVAVSGGAAAELSAARQTGGVSPELASSPADRTAAHRWVQMLGSFRPRMLAALILGLAGLFATPALAAEEQLAPAVETASVANLPSLATIVREQTAQAVADQAAAARQAAAEAPGAQALPTIAGRPLHALGP